jgi:hypothetical protein
MAVVVALAGAAGFLASFCLLSVGLRAMAIRYSLATVVGYGAFLLLIRAWLGWQRRTGSLELDGLPEFSADAGSTESFSGGGGEFGGAGASGEWNGPSPSTVAVQPPSRGGSADSVDVFSLDDAWPFLLAGAALLAGAVAIGCVIYTSPILFAEILLDAAVLGTIYRRSRRPDEGDWIGSVLRRTWLPATALCLFMAILGFALQAMAPGATSIGGVLRSVLLAGDP